MEIRQIKSQIRNSIHNNDPKASAYLFGSKARGDFRPGSDWDILILVNEQKVTNEIEDKCRNDLYDIELQSGQVISTFIYPKKYWESTLKHSPLYTNVRNQAIRL